MSSAHFQPQRGSTPVGAPNTIDHGDHLLAEAERVLHQAEELLFSARQEARSPTPSATDLARHQRVIIDAAEDEAEQILAQARSDAAAIIDLARSTSRNEPGTASVAGDVIDLRSEGRGPWDDSCPSGEVPIQAAGTPSLAPFEIDAELRCAVVAVSEVVGTLTAALARLSELRQTCRHEMPTASMATVVPGPFSRRVTP